jgi:hypothetical protein
MLLVAGLAAGQLATARAGRPPPLVVRFAVPHDRPVAGTTFAGLAVILVDPSTSRINRTLCDAEVGTTILHAHRQTFFEAGRPTRVIEVVCSWRLPRQAAGHRLRLTDNGDGPRASVRVDSAAFSGGMVDFASPAFSWIVRR